MTGWLIFAIYVAGWFVSTLIGARRLISNDALDELERRHRSRVVATRDNDKPLVDNDDRLMAVMIAASVSIGWPVIGLPALVLWLCRGALRTPIEREHDERRELEALRKLAREHNLPMPPMPGEQSPKP